ncbi:hypothetical protein BJ912DRAFT_1055318 [Pholiota molesta]|nr:hypothetical protein BJ912DRAFT_1055318 [Pholiota molesta]
MGEEARGVVEFESLEDGTLEILSRLCVRLPTTFNSQMATSAHHLPHSFRLSPLEPPLFDQSTHRSHAWPTLNVGLHLDAFGCAPSVTCAKSRSFCYRTLITLSKCGTSEFPLLEFVFVASSCKMGPAALVSQVLPQPIVIDPIPPPHLPFVVLLHHRTPPPEDFEPQLTRTNSSMPGLWSGSLTPRNVTVMPWASASPDSLFGKRTMTCLPRSQSTLMCRQASIA